MHQLVIIRLATKLCTEDRESHSLNVSAKQIVESCERCYVLMDAICWSPNHHTCDIFLVAQGYCEQGNDCICPPEWTGPDCDQGSITFCSSVYVLLTSFFIFLSSF